MQSILGVDLSSTPCEITVSNVSGTVVEVIDRRTVELPLLAQSQTLLHEDCSQLIGLMGKQKPESEVSPESAQTTSEVIPLDPERESMLRTINETVEALRRTVGEIKQPWTSTAVIIPPHEHLALNLNLPFGDAKNLSKIVDLEVQDVVPFELDDFIVQHSALGPLAANMPDLKSQSGNHDVHVALLPSLYVRNILKVCTQAGIDPAVLTVPSSAVGAIFHIGGDYFKGNAALLYSTGSEYSITLMIDGKVRAEQVVHPSNLLAQTANGGPVESNPVHTALKLIVAAAERRYGVRVDTVYLLNSLPDQLALHQVLGRPIEVLSLKNILRTNSQEVGLSALASFFAQDEPPVEALSNFRAGQFSFRPRFGELIRALRETSGYILAAIGVVALAIAGVYGVREYNLSRAHQSLIAELKTVVPDLPAEATDIRGALAAAETKLSQELGVLGSPAKITPLDALLETIRLVPESSGIQINSIKVSGTRTQVSGIAPQLSIIEDLERTLRSNKSLFSKTTLTTGTASGSRFPFNIELILAQ